MFRQSISLARPLSRSLISRPSLPLTLTKFYATNQVPQKPPSDDLPSMLENIKIEGRGVIQSVSETLNMGGRAPPQVGSTESSGEKGGSLASDVRSITSLSKAVPRQAWIFGGLGVIPYISTSLLSLSLSHSASISSLPEDVSTALALLHHAETVQITYGAAMLSFLGALHWGLEFGEYNGTKGLPRYLLGTAPVLVGWSTLLIPDHTLSMAAQWAAFGIMWGADVIVSKRGWTPAWYPTYRFTLTLLVGTSLLLTIGASTYWGPTSLVRNQRLARMIEEEKKRTNEGGEGSRTEGKVKGDLTVREGEDSFVKFVNVKKEEEEKKKQEEEEAKKKEEERREKLIKEGKLVYRG